MTSQVRGPRVYTLFGVRYLPNTEQGILESVDTESLLVDALAQVGVHARAVAGAPDQGVDLVLDPGGIALQVKHRALVTGEVAERLLRETPLRPDRLLLVVADRVTDDGRAVLIGHHAGYYDLRGHLALRSATIVIDVEVEPVSGRAERTSPLNGTVGLEVATALLMKPAEGVAVRELARRLGRSASTVSEILAALRGADLVDERHRVAGTELFWQVAERWPVTRTYLTSLPTPDATIARSLRLGLDYAEQTAGWALTDSAAAAAYGAPLAVSTGQLLDFYVPDQAIARRATTLLGASPSLAQARCAIRLAPVRAACSDRFDLVESNPFEWPLAHPVFVALDLAQDAGRGREVLADWTPPEKWARVW